jgi:hypothetical protein
MVIAPAMPPAPRTIAAHDVAYPSTVAADAPLRPKSLTPPAMMANIGNAGFECRDHVGCRLAALGFHGLGSCRRRFHAPRRTTSAARTYSMTLIKG